MFIAVWQGVGENEGKAFRTGGAFGSAGVGAGCSCLLFRGCALILQGSRGSGNITAPSRSLQFTGQWTIVAANSIVY
jgi:hypothetical protein